MTLPLSQVSQEAENLSLDLLSLEDARFRITLPAQIEYYRWGNREDDLKEQGQRLAEALEQTKRRWFWFLKAGTSDKEKHTSLGTLGYLPLEIRLKIYELLFNTQIKKINPYWGCFHKIPAWRDYLMDFKSKMLRPRYYYWMHFYYEACAFGCWNGSGDNMSDRPGPLNLRTYFAQAGTMKAWLQTPLRWASQSLSDEFANWIVGSRDFHFNCPASFAEFLHKLSSKQRTSLRRITIDLTGPIFMEGCIETVTNVKAWTSVFENLPSELSSLKQVTLMIGSDAKSFLDDQGSLMAWYEDEDDRVGETLRPLYGIDTAANLVSIVSTGLHEIAPTAVFHIPEYEYLDGGKQGVSENQLKISKALWSAAIESWVSFPFTPQLLSGWEACEVEEAANKIE